MTIPANITTELANLQSQVTAASPLAQAGRATVTAIKLNAGQLLNDIQSALVAPSNTLDTWAPPVDAPSIVTGFAAVVTAAVDQNDLSLKRGLVGRVVANLAQVPS